VNIRVNIVGITHRQQDIVDIVRNKGFVSVEDLAEQFEVAPQTIRRDVNALCDINLLRRRHGGAEYVDAPKANLPYGSRRISRLAAKQAIGAYVAGLVPNHASVSFGIGTTPEFVARAMIDHEDLTVVTNNVNVAIALSANPSNRIIMPGGIMRMPDLDFLGPHVEEMFRNYRVDFGVFGVGGIEPDGTFVDFDRAEVLARTALLENCRSSVLVADTSKFGRQAPASGGSLSDPDVIVLDAVPDAAIAPRIVEDAIASKITISGEIPS
jgi:DeoR family transcriptional regulator, glycerol-3-phosphate regulon repressor